MTVICPHHFERNILTLLHRLPTATILPFLMMLLVASYRPLILLPLLRWVDIVGIVMIAAIFIIRTIVYAIVFLRFRRKVIENRLPRQSPQRTRNVTAVASVQKRNNE